MIDRRREKEEGKTDWTGEKIQDFVFFGDTRVSGRGGACDVEAGNTVTEITS